MFSLGIAVVAIIEDGWAAHLLGTVVTVAALAAYVLESPRFFRLAFMWCAGYLFILAHEGLRDAEMISRMWGAGAFDTASRCIVASHLAVLLGHDLLFHEHAVRPSTTPWRLSMNSATALALLLWSASALYLFPTVVTSFSGGRVESSLPSTSATGVIIDGLVVASRVVAPIVATWIARRRHGAARYGLLAITATSLALELTLAVRFVLLFVAMGCVIAWLAPYRLSRRTIGLLAAAGLALAMASAITKESRTYGLSTTDLDKVAGEASIEYFVMSEASVNAMAQAVVYTERRGFTDGRTTASLFLFWVPRALWRDKPTMIGHWLPREFGRVDAGFSSAPTFTGGTFVDVGLWGSVVLWFLAGLFFGLVERWSARVLAADEDARVLLVAPLFGAAFFAVRSPETAGIALAGVLPLATLVLILTGRYPARRSPR